MHPAELVEALQRATTDARNPIIRFARDGDVHAVSDGLLALLGFSREEFEAGAIDWDELTPPQYWALDEYCLGQLLKSGVAEPYVKELVRKDGTRIAVRILCAINAGSPSEGVALVVELTERESPLAS